MTSEKTFELIDEINNLWDLKNSRQAKTSHGPINMPHTNPNLKAEKARQETAMENLTRMMEAVDANQAPHQSHNG